MHRQNCSDADTGDSGDEWGLLEIFRADPGKSIPPSNVSDPRPLWLRLDEEEDQLLIKRRKLRRLTRQTILGVFAAAAFLWAISGWHLQGA